MIHEKFFTMILINWVNCCKTCIYPYEQINNWEKFNETFLLEKEDSYSKLNMENITSTDYMDGKEFEKIFK